MITPQPSLTFSSSKRGRGPSLKHVSLVAGGIAGGIASYTEVKRARAPSSKDSSSSSRVRFGVPPFASLSISVAKHTAMTSSSDSRGTPKSGAADSTDRPPIGPCMQAMCGALAGAASRCIVAPFDVVKIRLQCQLEPLSSSAKYRGVVGSMATIVKEEGIVGLWRGTVPAVLLWMPYTAVQFTVLDQFSKWAAKDERLSKWDQTGRAFVGGAVAGAAATLTSYPLDLIRTNMAVQGTPKVYNTLFDCARGIVAQRGVKGLFAGLTPTLFEIIPHSSLQIGSYDLFKRAIAWSHGAHDGAPHVLSLGEKFCAGFAAGLLAKSAIHPLDVVKKRFQVAGLQRSTHYGQSVGVDQYKGMVDALVKIVRTEGRRGLYKGLTPNLLKAAPSSALTFMFYEFLVGVASQSFT